MKKNNRFRDIFLLLLSALVGVAVIVYGIQFFDIDPGGITEPKGEVSFGATSKLGWILTALFFVLVIIFSLARRLYYKIART